MIGKDTCSKCGSVYEITRAKVFKDTDTYECLVCGETLAKWEKATTIPIYKLIKRGIK